MYRGVSIQENENRIIVKLDESYKKTIQETNTNIAITSPDAITIL